MLLNFNIPMSCRCIWTEWCIYDTCVIALAIRYSWIGRPRWSEVDMPPRPCIISNSKVSTLVLQFAGPVLPTRFSFDAMISTIWYCIMSLSETKNQKTRNPIHHLKLFRPDAFIACRGREDAWNWGCCTLRSLPCHSLSFCCKQYAATLRRAAVSWESMVHHELAKQVPCLPPS